MGQPSNRISKEKDKNREKGRHKSCGRHNSPKNSKEKCWNCGKFGHLRRDFKEEKNKNKKKMNDFDDESEKYSQGDGGDSFVVALETHVGQSVWFTNFEVSFHMTSHQH